MPLSDSQVKAEQAGPRRRNVSVGDSLFLVIESASRGGGKSFEGRMRFPPGRQGKQVPVRIGVYGKGVGKWSLKEARDEWDRIRSWSKQHGKDPRDLKRQEKQALIQQSSGPTLQQACESYLAAATSKTAPGGSEIVINIRDKKLEKMIDKILKRTHYASPIEYLEDRIKGDHSVVIRNKKIG